MGRTVVPPQGAPTSYPPKPPSLEGGSVRRRGGCPPQGATNVQTTVIVNYQLSIAITL
ncbi:MAG: hypothetical protein LBM98_10245 [Oscillospiraceae bacterium]|nr:hypothetical protein [Oscillospiraceae bacterium]